MSVAVFCDQCGMIMPASQAICCADALCRSGKVYGAHICHNCWPLFTHSFDVYGHHLRLNKSEPSPTAADMVHHFHNVLNTMTLGELAKPKPNGIK